MELQGGKYLTFTLGHEGYGIAIQKVKEIIGMMDITKIPKTPAFIKGVINLRGKIIPIMDLRLKFDMEEKNYTERTCIIVVDVLVGNDRRQMGVAVDAVSEVVNMQASEIEPPPEYGMHTDTEFLVGLGKVKGKVITILDIEKVLEGEELMLLNEIKQGG